jgi:predicted transcriptional regulator
MSLSSQHSSSSELQSVTKKEVVDTTTPSQQKEVKIVDVPVTNENVALNLLVTFVNIAHKRGAFSLDESAKIWECVKMFQKEPPPN